MGVWMYNAHQVLQTTIGKDAAATNNGTLLAQVTEEFTTSILSPTATTFREANNSVLPGGVVA